MVEVKVFTLNIWGIGYGISTERNVRVKAIADYLHQSDYDIVLLQEVWMPTDFHIIQKRIQEKFPQSYFFDNGIVGSGTCVFSRHTILDTTFHEFSLNGYPHKINHGDWFAGKGLGVCQILFKGYILNVFVSHLHAEYYRNQDIYLGHRVMQALEAAQWIKLTSSGADLTIYAGDFNTEPSDNPYALITQVSQLVDCWAELNPEAAERGKGGETCATPYNSYTLPEERIEFPQGKRIDYIMYTNGPNTKARTTECRLPLPVRLPSSYEAPVSYSDHEAVTATILLEDSEGPSDSVKYRRQRSVYCEDRQKCVKESVQLTKAALKAAAWAQWYYGILCAVLLIFFLGSFSAYFLTENFIIDSVVFLVRMLLTLGIIYTLLMASILNKKERNALLGAKHTLELMASESKYKSL
eukprot:TRINITY_DN14538_c0_g1_i2.p1 TRINITY_DN14538_c0_g1~~TRINITY_DN14538_c0_g1_i2.p1  ORF type:complete len:418 (+),score=69.65 TRINITY_DN14538_c0_g1_i2:24-1256(+)